jgi:hypothetical protein
MPWKYLDKKAERRNKEEIYPPDFPSSADELKKYYGIRLQPGHMVLRRDMNKHDTIYFVGHVSRSLGGCDCCSGRGSIIAINDDLVAVCNERLEAEEASISSHLSFDDGKDEIRAEYHRFLEKQRASNE